MQLVVSTYTTTWSYWLNWRVLLSVTWVLASMVIASFMIWKYEGLGHQKLDRGETQHGKPQFLYYDEAWRPCIKEIHPIWLLAFRVIAFCLLLATLIVKVLVNGGGMFFYHTQWTFALFTIYFGLGSLLSLYGCYQYHKISWGFDVHHAVIDTEQGLYLPPPCGETTNMFRMRKISDHQEEKYVLHTSGIWGYVFQVIFQVSGGAVILTDCVYWLAIFLFLTTKDYNLNFMTVNMHTLNAIVRIGDAALNCLRFPWFRISYFVLWTGGHIDLIVQSDTSLYYKWPYPFLDLSLPYAPLWYFLVALMHIPCYGIFALIVKTKTLPVIKMVL